MADFPDEHPLAAFGVGWGGKEGEDGDAFEGVVGELEFES